MNAADALAVGILAGAIFGGGLVGLLWALKAGLDHFYNLQGLKKKGTKNDHKTMAS